MAVRTGLVDGQRTVGVAYCDVSAARFGVIEFVDSDQFSTLEGVLVQLGAKELVYAQPDGEPCTRGREAPLAAH